MGDKVWKACTAVAAVLAAATAVVSAALGGCDAMLECTNGLVPMKCHWCFVAVSVESVAMCVLALFGLFQKTLEGRRAVAVAVIVLVAVVLVECYIAIGVCAMSGMACQTTRLIVQLLMLLTAAASIVGFVKADPAAAEKPKMKL